MEKVHLIMPMGGAGSRFAECGYELPKPLIMLHDRPFFFWATQSLAKFLDYADITFVVLQEHIDRFDITERIREYYPEAKFRVLPKVLPGPMFTCLEGVAEIDDSAPIIFNDCDHMFMCEKLYQDMKQGTVVEDGALLTFTSSDPRFSYVREDSQGNVAGTVEKEVVSSHAICGAYLFRNKEIFLETAEAYKQDCPYNEFFMSGMYNILCKQQKKVRNYVLDFHVDYGTPAEYEVAKESSYFKYLK